MTLPKYNVVGTTYIHVSLGWKTPVVCCVCPGRPVQASHYKHYSCDYSNSLQKLMVVLNCENLKDKISDVMATMTNHETTEPRDGVGANVTLYEQ